MRGAPALSDPRLWLAVLLACIAPWGAISIEISSENEAGPGAAAADGSRAEVRFADSRLEFFVRSMVGRRRPAELQQSDVAGIREIDLDELAIEVVDGIGQLRGLTQLSLVSNKVSSIREVAKLRQLEELDLRGNRVQDIDALRRLDKLKVLRLDDNLIEDLTPLLHNKGLSTGDSVSVSGNEVDCDKAQTVLETLRTRGVEITSDCK